MGEICGLRQNECGLLGVKRGTKWDLQIGACWVRLGGIFEWGWGCAERFDGAVCEGWWAKSDYEEKWIFNRKFLVKYTPSVPLFRVEGHVGKGKTGILLISIDILDIIRYIIATVKGTETTETENTLKFILKKGVDKKAVYIRLKREMWQTVRRPTNRIKNIYILSVRAE